MKRHGSGVAALALILVVLLEAADIDVSVENRGVGHAWAAITCAHATAKISFGPAKPDDIATIFTRVPSTNNYHTGTATDRRSIRLNEAECLRMIEQVKSTEGTAYRLVMHNCATAVLEVLKAGGVNIYSEYGGLREYLSLTFATPASLAAELRKLNEEEARTKPVKHTVLINGKAFTARNVVLVIDGSGSMRGTDESIRQLRERLRTAGISIGAEKRSDGFGFGAATPRARDNALYFSEEALREDPAADAIYLFSDFDTTSETYGPDLSDPAGYARLRELLRTGRRRLYLGTVRMQPGEQLIRIAKESGGDVIGSR